MKISEPTNRVHDKGRDGGLGADARQSEEAREHNTGRDKMAIIPLSDPTFVCVVSDRSIRQVEYSSTDYENIR